MRTFAQTTTSAGCRRLLLSSAALLLCSAALAASFPKADEVVAAFKKSAGAVEEVKKGAVQYFIVRDAGSNVVKLAYLKEAKGYKNGKIGLFAIISKKDNALVFDSIQIVEESGAYKEVTKGREEPFMKQFAGKPADKKTRELKLDSMTSATMTSRSITSAIDQEQPNVVEAFGPAKK